MAEEEINSYDFYVKNFSYIKYMLDEKYINHDKNILLIIFYDNDLYKKYLNLRKENDFTKLIQNYFNDVEMCDNEEYGVFMIQGDITVSIDLIINNIFGESRSLEEEELKNLEIDYIMKNKYCFYVSLIKIYFFNDKGKMIFKFNEIRSNYSNEEK